MTGTVTEQDVTLPATGLGSVSPRVEGIRGKNGATRQVFAGIGYPQIPQGLLAYEIGTGGTAIIVATGPINGGWVTNPYNAAAQGIVSAENAYIDMVNIPGATDGAANNTTELLLPGQSFQLPALADGVHVYINAATTGHKFSGELW